MNGDGQRPDDTVDTAATRAREAVGSDAAPTPKTVDLIGRVARARVEGEPWDRIAVREGYANGESLRAFVTGKHSELWRQTYEDAREEFLPQVEAEARFTQRELMRPILMIPDEAGNMQRVENDTRIRQQAAHSLLQHVDRQGAQKLQVDLKGRVRHDRGALAEMDDAEVDEILAIAAEKKAAEPKED